MMHEHAVLAMAHGMTVLGTGFRVCSDEPPGHDDRDRPREFWIEGDELVHTDDGWAVGMRPVKYRILLERVDC